MEKSTSTIIALHVQLGAAIREAHGAKEELQHHLDESSIKLAALREQLGAARERHWQKHQELQHRLEESSKLEVAGTATRVQKTTSDIGTQFYRQPVLVKLDKVHVTAVTACRSYTLDFEASDRIYDVKSWIQQKDGYLRLDQALFMYNNKTVKRLHEGRWPKEHTLSDYNIQNGDAIHLFLCQFGNQWACSSGKGESSESSESIKEEAGKGESSKSSESIKEEEAKLRQALKR